MIPRVARDCREMDAAGGAAEAGGGGRMRPERWRRLKAVLHRALELPAQQREAFVEEACAGDRALEREARSLLAADAAPLSLLEAPALLGSAAAAAQPRIGPYRLEEELGRGGMGVVHRGVHERSGEHVALKSVRVPHEGMLQGIRREIHALSRLRHPGVVRIHEQGLERGMPWYAMELLEGATLLEHGRRLWQPGGPAGALRRLLGVLHGLCGVLAYVHGEGIVHRDLKPGNVLVRGDGTPVLVDFGVVAQFAGAVGRERLELGGLMVGTVAYMAPEQLRGDYVDARADLYSLGCMMFELLTGRKPFVAETIAELSLAHFEQAPPRPSELAGELPAGLDALVLELLAKRPEQRLGYADVAARRLAECGAEEAMAPPGAVAPARGYLYRPELAGRDAALEQLERQLDRLESAQGPGMVLVAGESGAGKTRLAMELGRLARRRAVRVVLGECAPGGGPLQALRGVLQAVADRAHAHGAPEAERLLGRHAAVLAPYEPSMAERAEPAETQDVASLPAAEARLRLFVALTETLGALAASRPLLLVLDDLQWADELSLGLLSFAQRSGWLGRCSRLLVLGTYRTEELGGPLRELAQDEAVKSLELQRLGPPAVGEMVRAMLALPQTPEIFAGFLARCSEGNPFFVAEYLREAVAEGLLVRDGSGRWQVAAGSDEPASEALYEALALPRSVAELVGRRLGGLGVGGRRAAEAAALLGREMDGRLLAEVAGLQGAELMEALEELRVRHVLEESEPGRLHFTHDKLREVAAAEVEPERRRALHRAAAEALAARSGAEREELQGALGHHWEQAGEPQRARGHYLAAARRSAARHAHAEAERLYRACLALHESASAESLAARTELGRDVLAATGKHREAIAELSVALGEARSLGSQRDEGECLRALSVSHCILGELDQAEALSRDAMALFRACGDLGAEGRAAAELGVVHWQRGELREAMEQARWTLEAARQSRDRRAEIVALIDIGNIHWREGSMDEARRVYEDALSLARESRFQRGESALLGNLAVFEQSQGRLQSALTLYEQALSISRETVARRSEGAHLANLANVHVQLGQFDAASDCYEAALAIARETGERQFEGQVLSNLSYMRYLIEPELKTAASLLERAQELFAQTQDRYALAICFSHHGRLELAEGRSATPWLERAEELSDSLGVAPQGEVAGVFGMVRRAQDAADAGEWHRLYRGELAEDLSEGIRRGLVERGLLSPGAAGLGGA
jgi:eukaryotic-like serine/threonine-protein kinase